MENRVRIRQVRSGATQIFQLARVAQRVR